MSIYHNIEIKEKEPIIIDLNILFLLVINRSIAINKNNKKKNALGGKGLIPG